MTNILAFGLIIVQPKDSDNTVSTDKYRREKRGIVRFFPVFSRDGCFFVAAGREMSEKLRKIANLCIFLTWRNQVLFCRLMRDLLKNQRYGRTNF